MAKRLPKRARLKKDMPVVSLTIRGAARHDDALAADVHAWVLLQMLDYFRNRKTFEEVQKLRFHRRTK